MITGTQLDAAIKSLRLSYADFARTLGVSYQFLHGLITDQYQPTKQMQKRLDDALLIYGRGEILKDGYPPILSILKNSIPWLKQIVAYRVRIDKELLKENSPSTHDEVVARSTQIEQYRLDFTNRKPVPPIYVIQVSEENTYSLLWGKAVLQAAQTTHANVFVPAYIYGVDKHDVPYIIDMNFSPSPANS